MCGIAGIVRFDAPGSANAARLSRIQNRLRHRGPDGAGTCLLSHAALAHTRLALLDERGGAQPMTSPDGRWTLVYNGEVYGCDGKPAWTLRTRSDTERVLAAFAEAGLAAVSRLNGMFAFFVWDELEQVGYAVRDRLGIKPFAFSWDGVELVFASEASAIAREMPSMRPRLDAVVEYLVAPCFSGVTQSMFEDVRYLQPGECLRIDREGLTVGRWLPRSTPCAGDISRDAIGSADLAAGIRAALPTAVERVSKADAPVGAFLSGGLDSTLICSLARTCRALSARFDEHDRFEHKASRMVVSDDVPFAAFAADELRLRHEWVDIPAASLGDDVKAVASIDDALPAWEQEVTQHRLFSAARSAGFKAMLVGDAADETHHGYHFLLDEDAVSAPSRLLARFGSPPLNRDVIAQPAAHPDGYYQGMLATWGLGYGSSEENLAATGALIRNLLLPRLLHNGDIHAMHFSVEARVPFGDIDLLAAADRVPMTTALSDGVEKSVLRDAAAGLIPERIRARRKSALPKYPLTDSAYRRLARHVLSERHPLVERLIDLGRFEAMLESGALDEFGRSAVFRVIGLHHWAGAFGVHCT